MPYISTESVKEKRKLIRKEFPDYKISVRRNHGSCIDVSILEGPVDLLAGSDDTYEQVNHYYIDEHYEEYPEVRDVLKRIYEIIDKSNGTECYDGDYGRIPHFYTHISIGNWDKPYKVIKKC